MIKRLFISCGILFPIAVIAGQPGTDFLLKPTGQYGVAFKTSIVLTIIFAQIQTIQKKSRICLVMRIKNIVMSS